MKRLLTLCLVLLLVDALSAQAPDPQFQARIFRAGSVRHLAVQPDGKILVAGDFQLVNQRSVFGLMRIQPDGQNDDSHQGRVTVRGPIEAMALQADGKLLAKTSAFTYFGELREGLLRIDADGYVDEGNFSPDLGELEQIRQILPMADGRILVAGSKTGESFTRFIIHRLNADGSRDTTFQSAGNDGGLTAVALQTDGKILLGGKNLLGPGGTGNFMIRLHHDGSVDEDFQPGFPANYGNVISGNGVQLLAVRPTNGHIISLGGFSQNRLIVFDEDGGLIADIPVPEPVHAVCMAPDGDLFLAGGVNTDERYFGQIPQNHIYRYGANGVLEQLDAGAGSNDPIAALALMPDNSLLAGGDFIDYDNQLRPGLVRLSTDNGTVDELFQPHILAPGTVNGVVAYPDGKVLAVGDFQLVRDQTENVKAYHIARLLPDGNLDPSFLIGAAVQKRPIYAAEHSENSNSLLVSARYEAADSNQTSSINGLTRLNYNGMTSTNRLIIPYAGKHNDPVIVAVDKQGYIYTYGTQTIQTAAGPRSFVRFKPDGTIDEQFTAQPYYNAFVKKILPLPDGRVLLTGFNFPVAPALNGPIIRINPDGSKDQTFNLNTPYLINTITDADLQSDGKIVILGEVLGEDQSWSNVLMRLDTAGALDTGFGILSFAGPQLSKVKALNDDRLLIYGKGLSPGGTPMQMPAIVNADGGQLTPMGYLPEGSINQVVNVPDGFIVGGKFAFGGGFTNVSLAKFNLTSTSRPVTPGSSDFPAQLFPNPTLETDLTLAFKNPVTDPLQYRIYLPNGQTTAINGVIGSGTAQQVLNIQTLHPGFYLIELTKGGRSGPPPS